MRGFQAPAGDEVFGAEGEIGGTKAEAEQCAENAPSRLRHVEALVETMTCEAGGGQVGAFLGREVGADLESPDDLMEKAGTPAAAKQQLHVFDGMRRAPGRAGARLF